MSLHNYIGIYKPDDGTWGISDQYVILDSWEKIEDSDISSGQLKFSFGLKQPTAKSILGVNADLSNVIEAQIGTFYLPSIPILPYILNDNADELGNPLPVPDPNRPRMSMNVAVPEQVTLIGSSQSMACFSGRLGIEMQELNTQSIIGLNGTRYHFEMEAELAPLLNNVIVSPISTCWSKFIFTEPITSIPKLTINIKNPDEGIFLPPDVLYNVTPFIAANSTGQPVISFRITKQNHNILVNDRIFIRFVDFTNGESDPLFKKVDKETNKIEGFLVGMDGTTVIDKNYIMSSTIEETTIRTNPEINIWDIVQTNPTKYYIGKVLSSATRVNICIAKNRIRIPIRFRKVVTKLTNYKSA